VAEGFLSPNQDYCRSRAQRDVFPSLLLQLQRARPRLAAVAPVPGSAGSAGAHRFPSARGCRQAGTHQRASTLPHAAADTLLREGSGNLTRDHPDEAAAEIHVTHFHGVRGQAGRAHVQIQKGSSES